ncbi:MAG: OsmC family protein, partial [Chloroflexia bacterium]
TLTELRISLEGEQDPEPPWAFRRIRVTYQVRGRGLSKRAVEQAIALAEEKYCSVRATLEGKVSLERVVQVVEEE